MLFALHGELDVKGLSLLKACIVADAIPSLSCSFLVVCCSLVRRTIMETTTYLSGSVISTLPMLQPQQQSCFRTLPASIIAILNYDLGIPAALIYGCLPPEG